MTFLVERRRVQRVTLIEPIRGLLDGKRVFIIDASLRSVRVAHQEHIGDVGDPCAIKAEWDGRQLDLRCQIVRTQTHRADAKSGRTLYHSGLTIERALGVSAITLRELVEWHVARALDEQKANAKGIPTIAPQSFQTGKGTHYIRHEFLQGRWRETATMDSAQPSNGFTVSAEHTAGEVQMLRQSFESDGSLANRDLIRKLAAMSISAAEGVPTRRYLP
jgi:hypothetical protein